MALVVQLEHPHAPVSTLQLRIAKAIDQFYYLLLFTTSSTYDSPQIWRNWLGMGFNVAIKEPPPGVQKDDEVKITTRPPWRNPELTVEGSNKGGLEALRQLLKMIDQARPSVAGQDDDARAEALLKGAVGQQLAEPVVGALQRHGFRAEEVDSFLSMMRRGLLALTHSDVNAIRVSNT